MKIKTIIRKNHPCYVIEVKVGSLDKTKCSPKFLKHNFSDDKLVNVKCLEDGTIDLRGKKGEYRILLEDNLKSEAEIFEERRLQQIAEFEVKKVILINTLKSTPWYKVKTKRKLRNELIEIQTALLAAHYK